MAYEMEGVLLGHDQDYEGLTGVSAIIFPDGAVGGVEVRGGAPATRETDLLAPLCMVERINAIVVAGGSAFGLAAADGAVRYLEGKDLGFDTGVARVPIVPAAAIFDLAAGSATARPDAAMGYEACRLATTDLSRQGSVGAGTGATVGKALSGEWCMRGGWGFASFTGGEGLEVAAFVAVNCFGDVVDEGGRIIAGTRNPEGGFLDTELFLEKCVGGDASCPESTNTTIGVIVTNANLDKAEINWVARCGHNGLARSMRPSHTKMDGDTVFAAAAGCVEVSADLVGVIGARTLASAVRNAVLEAREAPGIPAASGTVTG